MHGLMEGMDRESGALYPLFVLDVLTRHHKNKCTISSNTLEIRIQI